MTSKKRTKRVRKHASGGKAAKGYRIGNLRAMADDQETEWLDKLQELYKPLKKSITLRLDADVLAWFKRAGRGYQTRINRALRDVMMKERKG